MLSDSSARTDCTVASNCFKMICYQLNYLQTNACNLVKQEESKVRTVVCNVSDVNRYVANFVTAQKWVGGSVQVGHQLMHELCFQVCFE